MTLDSQAVAAATTPLDAAPRDPSSAAARRIATVGGGPAGLMAAEAAVTRGARVDLYEGKGSVGRKFLLAGKGGLNLTHAEDTAAFVSRYRERAQAVGEWLADFDAAALRAWAKDLGIDTFVGSSGRVFPIDLKAAPLLRAWVRRLKGQGVRFHVQHRLQGLDRGNDGRWRLRWAGGQPVAEADAVVLALGGASWPQLGSDGAWVDWLSTLGVSIAALRPANCGFDLDWSPHIGQRFAGTPVKPVAARIVEASAPASASASATAWQRGEFVVSASGVEGSLIYALSAELRRAIEREDQAILELDLLPDRDASAVRTALAAPRGKRTHSEHLRRQLGLDGVRAALLREVLGAEGVADPERLAAAIKTLPLRLLRARPIAEAISSAGGVRLDALDPQLMLTDAPGLFVAGEMLDWEAPTGGYLLTASFASGRRAGQGAARYKVSHPQPASETPR